MKNTLTLVLVLVMVALLSGCPQPYPSPAPRPQTTPVLRYRLIVEEHSFRWQDEHNGPIYDSLAPCLSNAQAVNSLPATGEVTQTAHCKAVIMQQDKAGNYYEDRN
jgi:hypothetical protein